MCRTIAKATPPFAGGKFPRLDKAGYDSGVKASIQSGQRAIKHDMGVIYRQRSKEYLQFIHDTTGKKENIRRTLRKKDGTPYLVDVDVINYSSVSEAIKWHWRKRLSNGRVKNYRSGNKDSTIGRWTSRDVMWVTPEIWDAVFQKLSANVGLSKAAFAKAAMRLGIKQKAPKYIQRHFPSANVSLRVSKNPSTVVINGSAPGLDVPAKKLRKVETIRMRAMVGRLERLVRMNAKKAGF